MSGRKYRKIPKYTDRQTRPKWNLFFSPNLHILLKISGSGMGWGWLCRCCTCSLYFLADQWAFLALNKKPDIKTNNMYLISVTYTTFEFIFFSSSNIFPLLGWLMGLFSPHIADCYFCTEAATTPSPLP